MFKITKKIIDERQELQSLKNARICWIVIIMLLAVSIIIQSTVYSLGFAYFLPECMIMLFACLLNIFLDISQGNLYTKDTQNTKRNIILYVCSSLLFSILLGVGNYLKWHFEFKLLAVVIIPTFIFMLSLMLLVDFFYRKAAKRRIKTLEDKMLSAMDSEEEQKS